MVSTMMNTHEAAPFSIAVALPTHLKSLVERMLQGLLRELPQHATRWHLSDANDADVTFRLHGEDGQAISPNLLADVRRRNGRTETLVIEGAWRAGAMTAALERIANLIVARSTAQPGSTLALQWLQRWCELRAQTELDCVALRVGERPTALVDLRSATIQFASNAIKLDPATLIATMAHEGWALSPVRGDTAPPPAAASSLKPLLWQLGLLAGEHGTLPALRTAGSLRLKGWPYLAAGGPASYADLVRHLRSGDNDRATLLALNLAPRSVVDGFLNACFVCGFFHDHGAAARAAMPAGARDSAREQAVISAIRRTLGIVRP